MRIRLLLLLAAALALVMIGLPSPNAKLTLALQGTSDATLAATQSAATDNQSNPAPTMAATVNSAALDFSAATTYKSPHDLVEISLPQTWQNTVDETQAQYVFTIDSSQRPPLFLQVTFGDVNAIFTPLGVSGPLSKPEDGLAAIKKNPPSPQFQISDIQSTKIGNLDAKIIIVTIPASTQAQSTEVELITAVLPSGQSVLVYIQANTDLWNNGGKDLADKMVASLVINTQNMTATPTLHPLLLTATSLQQQILALTPTSAPTSQATDAMTSTPMETPTTGPTMTQVATASAYNSIPQTTTSDGLPILGDPAAKVTIIEFADFSCPHCLEYHSIAAQIIDKYVRTGQARLMYGLETFVGAHYTDIGYNPSVLASETALCAGQQKGFWDMADAMYDIQAKYTGRGFIVDRLRDTAHSLNLDADKIVQCVNNHELASVLDKGIQFGTTLGVNSTPSLLYSTDGGQTFHWFKVIDPQTNTEKEQQGGGIPIDVIDSVITAAYRAK